MNLTKIVGILVVILGICLVVDIPKLKAHSEYNSKTIRIIERGSFNGIDYKVFEDEQTKTRIFYYRDAMVILPKS